MRAKALWQEALGPPHRARDVGAARPRLFSHRLLLRPLRAAARRSSVRRPSAHVPASVRTAAGVAARPGAHRPPADRSAERPRLRAAAGRGASGRVRGRGWVDLHSRASRRAERQDRPRHVPAVQRRPPRTPPRRPQPPPPNPPRADRVQRLEVGRQAVGAPRARHPAADVAHQRRAREAPAGRPRRDSRIAWCRPCSPSKTTATTTIPASIRSAIVRAVFTNLVGGAQYVSGASTITQQVVRNVFLPQFDGWTLQLARAAIGLGGNAGASCSSSSSRSC